VVLVVVMLQWLPGSSWSLDRHAVLVKDGQSTMQWCCSS
jgi:hypothetical protein